MTFSRQHAFTLIELLVVMAIISIAATLIGPLALNQYERSQQTAEREALLRLLDHYTFTAYSHNQDFTLVSDGQTLTLYEGEVEAAQGVTEAEWEFEFLSFPQQQIYLNSHGFWQPNLIAWREGEREQSTELNMPVIENGGADASRD
jgi:prepilin-type N-terminal cleavage/methylation domain-containing protein